MGDFDLDENYQVTLVKSFQVCGYKSMGSDIVEVLLLSMHFRVTAFHCSLINTNGKLIVTGSISNSQTMSISVFENENGHLIQLTYNPVYRVPCLTNPFYH